ncbi:MAG: signal peptidase II [Eubacteriales bacterium]|nr:signal peptidase II [Eubacteriales bacterium]
MTVIMSLLAICVMVLVDQVVKYWAITMLAPVGSIPLIPGVLQLTYVENRGAAFSILENQIWLFVLLAVVILCGIFYALHTNRIQHVLGKFSLLVISAGAVGNVIDRVVHHYVVDMIEVRFIQFPVFNIADIYVTVGVVLFAVYYLFLHKDADEADEVEKK